MDIIVKGHEYFYDITSMSMLFFPGEKTSFVSKSRQDIYIRSILKTSGIKKISVTKIKYFGRVFVAQKTDSLSADSKDLVKYTFYNACKKATGISSPWGTLTGIRPLSVYERLKRQGLDAAYELKKRFLVSDEKINVLKEISDAQNRVVKKGNKDVSLYISIPFCPSKCTYCSFISISAVNKADLLTRYISLLIEEIKQKSELVKKYDLNVCSIYIGGGTPGILSVEELQTLLDAVDKYFDLNDIEECCFEMGRPDTVTADKLEILGKLGFNRVCINTQTTNDTILSDVNRKHSCKNYFDAIDLTKSFKFNSINTDLIAGLPGESVESFKKSVNDVISTGIDNITIHTLSIKKAATLSQTDDYYNPVDGDVSDMVDYAYCTLKKNGYSPYYIYRQKNCVSNGENIGFSKPETPCLYNIYMMEDIHSVIACGAGASTKIVNGTNVSRVINVKYPMDYVADFEKVLTNTQKIEQLLKAIVDYV